MYYLCLACGEVYNIPMNFCPKSFCGGTVIELDELMLPIIKTLNEKDYSTTSCCSGHLYNSICGGEIPYILFSPVDPKSKSTLSRLFKNVPAPWTVSWEKDCRMRLSCRISKSDEVEMLRNICDASISLLDFVMNRLPALDEDATDIDWLIL